MFSFLLDKYPGVKLLSLGKCMFINFLRNWEIAFQVVCAIGY